SALALAILTWLPACSADWAGPPGWRATTELSTYTWTRVSDQAGFPGSYNFPIFSIKGKIWAFHNQGNWDSEDEGKSWNKAALPPLGLNTGYQQYLQFKDSIYALGAMRGNYLNLKLDSRITRTTDMKTWEVVAQKSELPPRVFYGATVFKGQMWLVGGFDGNAYYNDVWTSIDGIKWTRVAGNCPWAQRCNPSCLVFEGKMWLIGGGIIDGENFNDVWYSADG